MKGKVFFDTNFFVYLFSATELEKRTKCFHLLERLKERSCTLVWSTQIIQEFYNVMTLKFNKDPRVVKSSLKLFDHFELVVNNRPIIENAIDIQTTSGFSFWDSLVVSAALHANCSTIITEDLSDGQSINGILIQNPFTL